MKPKWIVAIILASVAAGMLLLTCGVRRWGVSLEAQVHAAHQQSDPWQGLSKGWIILTLMEQGEDGQTQLNGGFEVLGGSEIKARVAPLPIPADRIRLVSHYAIRILGFANTGQARLHEFPGAAGKITNADETQVFLPIGTEVIVEQIRISHVERSQIKLVWAFVSRP
jgi:hypothetical protein